jgi:lipopolysaccharide export system permease protein
MPLWKKELIKKILLKSFFILTAVSLLYILVDFSINSIRLLNASIINISKYYLIQIFNYLDIFLPISFLIAMVKTLSEMNISKELLVLFSAGLSKKTFLKPLYYIAIVFSIICLYNNEIIVPKSAKFMDEFQRDFFSKKKKYIKKNVNSIFLDDQTQLIFSRYIHQNKTLEDVFWIKNFNDIWHIKTIEVKDILVGHFLDHFTRKQNHRLIKKDSFKTVEMSNLPITKEIIENSLIPLEKKSISKLLLQKNNGSLENSSEKTALASLKIIFSISFFLIIIGIAPYCLTFSRLFSPFFILSLSIFAFIFFCIMIRTLSILCVNQVLSCLFGLWFPCIMLTLLSLYGYFRKSK